MQNRFYCQLSCGKKNCLVEWKLYPLWNCCGNRVMKRDKVFFLFLLFIYRLFFFLVAHLDVCSSKDSHPAQPEMCAQRCFCLKNFRIRLDSLVRYEFHWFTSCRGRLRAEKKVGVGGSVFRAWKELPKCTKWCEYKYIYSIYTHITYHMIISRYYVCISWMAPNHYQTDCTFFGVQFTGQLTGSMLSNGFCGKHHGYSEMTLWIPEWKR